LKLVKTKPERQSYRQIKAIDATIGKVLERAVQPQLPTQDTEHKFMTKPTVIVAHTFIKRRQQRRRVRAFLLNSAQD